MPRLSTRSAIWILIFLLSDLTNAGTLEKDISVLDFEGKRLTFDSSENFWKRRLLYNNNSIERIDLKSMGKISQVENGQGQAKDTNAEGEYKCVMEDINKKTLINYNGPEIMEDSDNASDQTSTNYVRVKRSGSTNNSIIHHQQNHSMNLIDTRPNFCSKNDTISALGESMSKFDGSYIDLNHKYGLGTMNGSIGMYSRRKRGVLSKNGRRRKRIKGNIAKHRTKAKIGSKKHGTTLKLPHKPGKRNKKKKPAITVSKSRMRSRIEKRESKDNSSNTYASRVESIGSEKAGGSVDQKEYVSLLNNRSSEGQPGENRVVLPFVHAGRAELRVRIEKVPTNESAFVKPNIWTDRSSTTDSFSTVLPRYDAIDEITNTNATNTEATPNFESAERKGANDSTMEITLKLNYGGNTSKQEASDSGNRLLHNAEDHSIESALPESRNGRNAKDRGDRADKTPVKSAEDEDAKSRAKRNQERFRDAEQRTLVGGAARERKRYRRTRGRAGRSIEEIKELAEKLVAKVNELQMYVSNVSSKTTRTTHSCIDKNDCTDVEAAPRSIVSEHSSFKDASNINGRRERLAKSSGSAGSTGARAFRTLSNTSRFARGYRNGERTSRRKWGRWMDWSSCSVTCGKGRQIRWRHCLRDCDDAETEMEEKACQLPACPPGKFLGIF